MMSDMPAEPKVFLIILNWNQCEDTIECIKSCERLNYKNFEILVLDNASEEGSVESIRSRFPDVGMIRNTQNLGYAKGNNVGIKYALDKGADYVFILNSDTTLDENVLHELIKAARSVGNPAILAPKVYYYDRRNVINSMGTTINWFRLRPNLDLCGQEDNGRFGEIRQKDILVGCALLINKMTFEKIGFFDEKFFAFHEDADLSLRNMKYGGKNLVVPKAIVYHKVSGSVKNCQPLVSYYTIRNFLYLAKKNASSSNKIKMFFGLQFLIVKNALISLFGGGRKAKSLAFFCGIVDYFAGKMGRTKRVF